MVRRNTIHQRGIASKVLIGEKEHAFSLVKGPLHDRRSVGRGTDNTAVTSTECFQICRRVHVGDGYNRGILSKQVGKSLPAFLYLRDIRHIGHRAAGSGIWKDNFLLG